MDTSIVIALIGGLATVLAAITAAVATFRGKATIPRSGRIRIRNVRGIEVVKGIDPRHDLRASIYKDDLAHLTNFLHAVDSKLKECSYEPECLDAISATLVELARNAFVYGCTDKAQMVEFRLTPESVPSSKATRFSTWNSQLLVEYVVISRAEAAHQCAGAIRRPFHAVLRGSGIISPKLIHAHWKWTQANPGLFGWRLPTAALRGSEMPVMVIEHSKAAITRPQAQNPAPSVLDHSSRLEHHLLYHRLDTTTFGCVAYRRIGFIERVLTNQAQQVHCHCGELAHQASWCQTCQRANAPDPYPS